MFGTLELRWPERQLIPGPDLQSSSVDITCVFQITHIVKIMNKRIKIYNLKFFLCPTRATKERRNITDP